MSEGARIQQDQPAPGIKRVAALTSTQPGRSMAVKHDEPPVATDAYLDAILRAARDPSVDIDKMERLMRMREQMLADEAKKTFIRAKIRMRPLLPKVEKRGDLLILEKGTTKVIQSTAFARFEDIHDATFPILIEHGFDLDYRTGSKDGRVVVTAVLSHQDGHREETTLEGPLDTTGSKNNVQGVGSTLSYLKRYTMCALLNIRTADKGEFDDDGHAAGMKDEPETITPEQVKTLRKEMGDRRVVEAKFLEYIKEAKLEDIAFGRFEAALANIQRRPKVSEARNGA